MEKKISIRILQLKNNFYWDNANPGREALGEYCVIGYFDAFDISGKNTVKATGFSTWGPLGELTAQLDGTVNCRMLVCVTERQEEDAEFWEDEDPSSVLYFVTMIRVSAELSADEMYGMINLVGVSKKRIGYLSYDHSEMIVVTKTNRYSDGIKGIRELRKLCRAVKTYTVFAITEKFLESYETIQEKVADERVFCRLHCMVKDYEEAEKLRKKLEQQISDRNERKVTIRKFETFGGYDWLLELDDVSICSILECYKMKNLLTHANEMYNKAFFNIESEILVGEGEKDGDMDRKAETAAEGKIHE